VAARSSPAPAGPGLDWVGCQAEPLPVADAVSWAGLDRCGAIASFVGTVRDHAEGRSGVHHVTYEAYEEHVVRRLQAVVAEARARWADLGRIALLHRTGRLAVGEASVVVVVSAGHRADAFDTCRFCIDTVKAAVPIWKREEWDGGADWGLGAQPLRSVGETTVTVGGSAAGPAR
jgi:molybdopterin synthase catalytic subunit